MSNLRFITGCAAVHPDQRGGQHVARQCPGVLAIDDDAQIGVLVNSERSQFANKQKATEMLAALRSQRLTAEEVESLRWAMGVLSHESTRRQGAPHGWHNRAHAALSVLDKLIARYHAQSDVESLVFRLAQEIELLRDAVAEAMLRAYLYNGYSVGSRHVSGCLLDALDAVAPDIAAEVRDGADMRDLYQKHYGDRP